MYNFNRFVGFLVNYRSYPERETIREPRRRLVYLVIPNYQFVFLQKLIWLMWILYSASVLFICQLFRQNKPFSFKKTAGNSWKTALSYNVINNEKFVFQTVVVLVTRAIPFYWLANVHTFPLHLPCTLTWCLLVKLQVFVCLSKANRLNFNL